jgi:hypothetical protein
MTAYIVSVTRETYVDLLEKLPMQARFTDMQSQSFPSPHFWLYTAAGDVVVFTAAKIEERSTVKLEGQFT